METYLYQPTEIDLLLRPEDLGTVPPTEGPPLLDEAHNPSGEAAMHRKASWAMLATSSVEERKSNESNLRGEGVWSPGPRPRGRRSFELNSGGSRTSALQR
jgi:hypothetical protein